MKKIVALALLFISIKQYSQNLIWAKQMGGSSSDYALALQADASGNFIIGGKFAATADFDPGVGTSTLTALAGSYDAYFAKYDNTGNLVWVKQFGGSGNEAVTDMIVDASGSITVVGFFMGTADFDPGAGVTNLTSAGDIDIFIARYTNTGNFVWAKKMGGVGEDYPNKLRLDATGNCYVTGYYTGTADFDPGAPVYNLVSTGFKDMFLARYDNTGNFVWANSVGGNADDKGLDLLLNSSGDIYLTGYFGGSVDFDPGAGLALLNSTSAYEVFLAKYNSSGNYIWAKNMPGTAGNNYNQGTSLQLDAVGNVLLGGGFSSTIDLDPGPGTATLTSAVTYDVFIAKYDNSGNYIWSKCTGAGSVIFWLDATDNIYVAGIFSGTADLDPGAGVVSFTSAGYGDTYFGKYDNMGNYLWAAKIGGPSVDQVTGLHIDQNGDFIIAGYFDYYCDFDPGAGTLYYNCTAGSPDIFLAKYNGTSLPTGIINLTPDKLYLSVYPNPTNSKVNLSFKLKSASEVKLTLNDALGRKIQDIENTNLDAGDHKCIFEIKKPGIYFIEAVVNRISHTQKLVVTE